MGFILSSVRAQVQGRAQGRETNPQRQGRDCLTIGSASEREEWDMVGLGTMDVARALSGVLVELQGTIIPAGQVCHCKLRCRLFCATVQFMTDISPLVCP